MRIVAAFISPQNMLPAEVTTRLYNEQQKAIHTGVALDMAKIPVRHYIWLP